jgi:uncharacterized circularly permuted ATP-grasp superfamily protein/uncharacterized alpha-E superfamily protein
MTLAAAGREDAVGILDGYRSRTRALSTARPDHPVDPVDADPRPGPVDELLDAGGAVRPASAALAATVDLLGTEGIRARGRQARRLLEDDGVTYGTHGPGDDAEVTQQAWRLDPLPVIVDGAEWAGLAAGLAQRARLMDLLMGDLYGARTTLERGLLPPEVIYGHGEFLRQCDGLRLPGAHQLPLFAADLVRRADGWTVLDDRAQAPSGAGYAMENRRIVSRVMPGLYRDTLLERLRSFFHTVRAALQEAAPAGAEPPQVVILTPGHDSETSFDQAFLATLLGYPLVEGQDLVVRDGRLWMRSLGRPQPVDVVLRRVDSWFCDPLQLRPDSALGVPGLLEAARAGNVAIVNPPGSGVLENPGLLPFLHRTARALLGEDLLLPSAPTWWCGDPVDRSHVLARLEHLVVRPITRGVGRANRFGWTLSRAERADLRARIEAEPHAWCGQEPLRMSTVPVVTGQGLEPRHMVLRGFAVGRDGGYAVMAGGLGRVAAAAGSLDVSSQAGALAKDVWVVAERGATTTVLTRPVPAEPDLGPVAGPPARVVTLSARGAEDLFWLGRYAERAEDAARLLRVATDLAGDHGRRPGTVGAQSLEVVLRALTAVTTTFPGFTAPQTLDRPFGELARLATHPYVPGTLGHAVRRTLDAAHAVRELLSADTWLVLGGLDRVLAELGQDPAEDAELGLAPVLSRVLEGLLAMSGLAAESMVRDAGWYLMDVGRRIERALQLVALLRHTLDRPRPASVDDLVIESVLIAAESVITHRRRNPGRPRVQDVLQLLLLDRTNPRSARHQLDLIADGFSQLPGQSPQPRQILLRLQARLREAEPRQLAADRPELVAVLTGIEDGLRDLADAVALTHFARHVPPQPQPGVPAVMS